MPTQAQQASSKLNHTPGPWQVANFNEQTYTVDVETVERGNDVPEKGYIVARVYCGPDGSSPDAQLLAAAPELLDACRQIVRLGDWPNETPKGFTAAWESAVAAIAKAKRK